MVGCFDAVRAASDRHAPIVVSQFRNKSDLHHTIVNFGVFDEIAELERRTMNASLPQAPEDREDRLRSAFASTLIDALDVAEKMTEDPQGRTAEARQLIAICKRGLDLLDEMYGQGKEPEDRG